MKEINIGTFEGEVVNSDKPVVLDFWGPQWGPCTKLLPQVEALEGRYAGRVKFAKVEAPTNRRLCMNLKVMGIPAFLFYKGGKEVGRLAGPNMDIAAVEEKVAKLL